MAKIDIKLWEAYKLGKLNRELTSEEQIGIDNCDLVMNLLMPTKSFLKLYNELICEGWAKNQIINVMAKTFGVPVVVAKIKIHDIENDLQLTHESKNKVSEENVIVRGNIGFWKRYKLEGINRVLLPLEKQRIDECDEALRCLIDTDSFVEIYNFLNSNELSYDRIVAILSVHFKVPYEFIEVKINEVNGNELVKRCKM